MKPVTRKAVVSLPLAAYDDEADVDVIHDGRGWVLTITVSNDSIPLGYVDDLLEALLAQTFEPPIRALEQLKRGEPVRFVTPAEARAGLRALLTGGLASLRTCSDAHMWKQAHERAAALFAIMDAVPPIVSEGVGFSSGGGAVGSTTGGGGTGSSGGAAGGTCSVGGIGGTGVYPLGYVGAIDPRDPRYHDMPLWVVYRSEDGAPQVLYAKLHAYTATHQKLPKGKPGPVVCIWGYSVYQGEPGFRTLGITIESWGERSALSPVFYNHPDPALWHLHMLQKAWLKGQTEAP